MATKKKTEEKVEKQVNPAPDMPPEKIQHYPNDPARKSSPDPKDAPIPRSGDPYAYQRDPKDVEKARKPADEGDN